MVGHVTASLTRRSLSEGGSEDGARRQDRIVYVSLVAALTLIVALSILLFRPITR
jgi:hypothetical protein